MRLINNFDGVVYCEGNQQEDLVLTSPSKGLRLKRHNSKAPFSFLFFLSPPLQVFYVAIDFHLNGERLFLVSNQAPEPAGFSLRNWVS
jgi:hypothetical protein